ncbi:hypothetical protein [Nostoc linckia]|uniref:hypothetical protein n=2 Tax=Nostoc linckia TaxID=92942 RepID=UPI0015D4A86E|nr:hypothetical protein [Nostoc linckia]
MRMRKAIALCQEPAIAFPETLILRDNYHHGTSIVGWTSCPPFVVKPTVIPFLDELL